MGPPHGSWRHPDPTKRHGMQRGNAMLTQLSHIEAAPKWSIGQRIPAKPAGHDVPGPGEMPDIHGDSYGKYKRQKGFAFGSPEKTKSRRPGSAPAPQFNPKLGPSGPQWSFSQLPRPNSAPTDGPGPAAYYPSLPQKPGFSMYQRYKDATKDFGPGPKYNPKVVGGPKFAIGWVPDRPRRLPDPSPGPGPVPPSMTGLKYSAGVRREEKPPPGPGPGGSLAYTHFGYDDFGRAGMGTVASFH
eukprot:gnl/TRDRNA2_/TRDRNA2_29352_c0_seq1.p1 gnl/TRDRNA2_/TRDRNA2_29352_c0~~gnl/TRDRNA2_/TRDRNA2_29352_c0_seq1.p1  ORF type:complete len:242 (-),score=24.88 gnl/TRDRNA2_/TRDRNA2_29352_c0_seq1:34-759(-)